MPQENRSRTLGSSIKLIIIIRVVNRSPDLMIQLELDTKLVGLGRLLIGLGHYWVDPDKNLLGSI